MQDYKRNASMQLVVYLHDTVRSACIHSANGWIHIQDVFDAQIKCEMHFSVEALQLTPRHAVPWIWFWEGTVTADCQLSSRDVTALSDHPVRSQSPAEAQRRSVGALK